MSNLGTYFKTDPRHRLLVIDVCLIEGVAYCRKKQKEKLKKTKQKEKKMKNRDIFKVLELLMEGN